MSDVWFALSCIGVPLAVTGVLAWRTRRFLARAKRTQGTIVEMQKLPRRGRRDRFYAPIVEFSPKGGPRVQFRAHTVTSTTLRRKGEDVAVLYEPADPAGTARIADDTVAARGARGLRDRAGVRDAPAGFPGEGLQVKPVGELVTPAR